MAFQTERLSSTKEHGLMGNKNHDVVRPGVIVVQQSQGAEYDLKGHPVHPPCQAISSFDRPLWAEPCLGETRDLEDPAPALKELFVLPGEPRSQLHQLPKNPLSELPVVKCKVGQCHSEPEGLVSEGLQPRQTQQILGSLLLLEGYNCKLTTGAEEAWACHRQRKWHVG